jgi:hypothetical protein
VRITALVVLVLGAALGIVATSMGPAGGASPGTTPTVAAPKASLRPGIEPPVDGEWPYQWPKFGPTDHATTVPEVEGLGFAPRLPGTWTCAKKATTDGSVGYACGAHTNDGEIGGDLIVRVCADPCDRDRRVQLRQVVDAWGLQWIREPEGYLCWAETNHLDGQARYALALVGYWRSAPEGAIDRQVVLHLTAAPAHADDLRKVATAVHSILF